MKKILTLIISCLAISKLIDIKKNADEKKLHKNSPLKEDELKLLEIIDHVNTDGIIYVTRIGSFLQLTVVDKDKHDKKNITMPIIKADAFSNLKNLKKYTADELGIYRR